MLLKCTGYVGGHVASDILAHGAKIRLVVRNEEKAARVLAALKKVHGASAADSIDTILIKDFSAPDAFDEACKGVQGVAHVASDVSFSDDPKQVIDPILKIYKSLLGSMIKTPSIRRFVFTSSSIAIGFPNVNGKETRLFDSNGWNDEAVELIKDKPTGFSVYGASKVLSERTVWDFVKEKKPQFVTTAINPNLNVGPFLPGVEPSSTGAGILKSTKGDQSFLEQLGPQFHIDVRDVAELHSIALFNEEVGNERLLAFAERYTINSVLETIKAVDPDAPVSTKPEWGNEDNSKADTKRSQELLGRPFRSLEESIRDLIDSVKAA